METLRVGIREFREKLASYLLHSERSNHLFERPHTSRTGRQGFCCVEFFSFSSSPFATGSSGWIASDFS